MTSPAVAHGHPPQASPATSQTSALPDRISDLLPHAGDQALMLHWLTGYLGHSPQFTAAAGLYLDMAQRRQAGSQIGGHPGPAGPASPRRDDSVTINTCPACGQPFTPSGRRRWCSAACKQAAWRRSRTPATPVPPIPPPGRKPDFTVYECGSCGLRTLGSQRCQDCGTFMAAVGTGGPCPHCDEPVAIQDISPARDR
jgi:hypothetical protein